MNVTFQNLKKLHYPLLDELKQDACRVIESGQYLLSNELTSFERNFSEFTQTKGCAAVNSGLSALELLLQAAGIQASDEVLVPSHTFIATWLAILNIGATPVPVDPQLDTYNLDPLNLQNLLSKKTKALIVVHLYGHPCNMDAIQKFCENHNLILLEDAAQAHGASYKGKPVGSFGLGAAWSFYPGKNLGALGDGGAVTSNDELIIADVKQLRNYGSKDRYHFELAGNNSRLSEIQSAFLNTKLKYIPQWNLRRQQIAFQYTRRLKNIGDLLLPVTSSDKQNVWHQYVIKTKHRDHLKNYLNKKGIETQIHYPIPIGLQKSIQDQIPSIKVSKEVEKLCNTILSLPISPEHTDQEIDYIASSIMSFYGSL